MKGLTDDRQKKKMARTVHLNSNVKFGTSLSDRYFRNKCHSNSIPRKTRHSICVCVCVIYSNEPH